MNKIITTLFGLFLAFSAVSTGVAYASHTYTPNTRYHHTTTTCTLDAYTCPNGTTVGRTGSNCQFVCPRTSYTPPVQNSYTYTSGCYTYYYDGYTRSSSVVSYNCSNNYNTYNNTYGNYAYTAPSAYYYTAPSSYYYTTPSSYTYNTSPYSTYQYQSYYYPSTYSTTGYTDTGYTTYTNNYNYTQGCVYVSGYQVCY